MSFCINPNCSKPKNPDNFLFCQACGSELLLAGRYRVTRLLSDKGGFGNTYEVIHHNTFQVLKVLTNNHPKAVELFEQEAQVLSQLNHPGIPKGEEKLLYFPRDSQTPLHCLVMEKIEGMDLEEYQKQRENRPIDQKLALEWLRQLAEILHEVHGHNFFHRDIKPSNIILRANDAQLTLIDFGAVRQVTATIIAGGQNTGVYTPGYAPSEQEKGYAVPQSDFYALGRTFVYLLTGKKPTDTTIYDHYNNELRWHSYASNIAPQLANFIDHLMAEKANQRPANTSVILQRLTEIERELHHPQWSSPPPEILETVVNPAPVVSHEYAGFWSRSVAYLIDTVIVTIVGFIIGGFFGMPMISEVDSSMDNAESFVAGGILTFLGTTILGIVFLPFAVLMMLFDSENWSDQSTVFLALLIIGMLLKWLYFTLLESSAQQATCGKRLIGIIVTDLNSKRISFCRANGRYWGKSISTIIICFGFILASLTERKQALHDKISDCLVVKKRKI
ncbi:MAG: RDD family protein [Xenococcaceae cyanobacterium]